MVKVNYIQKGFKLTAKSKKYINEKIKKHSELLKTATSLTILLKYAGHYPADKRYRMEISVTVPHTFIKAEDRGMSPEELIDKLEVVVKRKLMRYQGQFKKWERQIPWKVKEAREELGNATVEDEISYNDYEPPITKAKIETNRSMHVGEALERMEMSGNNAYLFKNIETEKYAMLYRSTNSDYILVEADD